MDSNRPSGQSVAWYHGFDWAYDRGEHASKDCADAIEACGYNLDEPEAEEFERGAEYAQNEQAGELFGYD